MARYAMVIDLDKCVGCQACTIACRQENNTPAVSPDMAAQGRAIRWNDVLPMPVNDQERAGAYPNVKMRYVPRPCMQCSNPICIKVCPVQATYADADGVVRVNYNRCIGCRFCAIACPYSARYFNWEAPSWTPELAQHLNPDLVSEGGSLEGPAVRPRGVIEKCTFCIHRLRKAQAKAQLENRSVRADEYVPACVETCPARARFFGDLDDPESTVSRLASNGRAFRLLEEVGTRPNVIYLREG